MPTRSNKHKLNYNQVLFISPWELQNLRAKSVLGPAAAKEQVHSKWQPQKTQVAQNMPGPTFQETSRSITFRGSVFKDHILEHPATVCHDNSHVVSYGVYVSNMFRSCVPHVAFIFLWISSVGLNPKQIH